MHKLYPFILKFDYLFLMKKENISQFLAFVQVCTPNFIQCYLMVGFELDFRFTGLREITVQHAMFLCISYSTHFLPLL